MEIEKEPLKVRLPEAKPRANTAETVTITTEDMKEFAKAGTVTKALAEEWSKPADVKLVKANPKTEDEMGQYFLDKVFAAEPAWKERDEACMAEWGLTPAQRVVRYITIVLDQQAHLNLVPGYDFPEQGSASLSPLQGECPECKKQFNRQFPGQVCCSNECGEKHFPKQEPKPLEYSNDFNEAVAAHMEADIADGPPVAAFPVGSGIR